MIQTVKKRDGRIVGFNEQKVMAAIRKAMLHTDKGEDERLLYQITDRIAQRGESQMTVEETARQYSGNIQVLSATLNQDFALGILHWDNEVTAQYSSRDDILPLPLVNVYSNLYLKFTYAKVLRIQLGGDVRYFTAYYAPTYCPGFGMYHLQNTDPEARVAIGNYPIVNV